MKKLLVILLLLFPFHGAWGKKISLNCDNMIMHLDTNTRLVHNNRHDLIGINLREEGNLFVFDMLDQRVAEYGKTLDRDDILSIKHSIDRHSGVWSFKITSILGKSETVWPPEGSNNCEELTKKKF